MNIPQPMEMAFALPILNKFDNFYSICDNHCEHDRLSYSNKFPFVRLDMRSQLWDLDMPEDEHGLVDRVMEFFWDDFREQYQSDWAEKENGFRICFDMNGYRIIAKLPIYDLWEERNELEEELDEEDLDADEIDDRIERVKEIDEELVACAPKLLLFEKIVGWHKEHFKDFVVVEDEDKHFDIVHKDWFEDMKEENGWKLWVNA